MVLVEQNGHAQFWCFKTLCARAHMQVPCYGVRARARVSCRSVAPLLLVPLLLLIVKHYPSFETLLPLLIVLQNELFLGLFQEK